MVFIDWGNPSTGFINGVASFVLGSVSSETYIQTVFNSFKTEILDVTASFNGTLNVGQLQPGNLSLMHIYGLDEDTLTGELNGGVYDGSLFNHSTFKHGSWQPFGIVYYDRALRSGTNNISGETKIYIPSYTEEIGPPGNDFITQDRKSVV